MSGDTSATDVGSYVITITGAGDYEGEATVSWKIQQASSPTLAVRELEFMYTEFGSDIVIGAPDLEALGMPKNAGLSDPVEFSLGGYTNANGTVTLKIHSSNGTVTVTGNDVDRDDIGKYFTVKFNVPSKNYQMAKYQLKGTIVDNYTPEISMENVTVAYTGSAIDISALEAKGLEAEYNDATVEGTFAWTDGAPTHVDESGKYEITFTPTDTIRYKKVTKEITVTLSPIELTISGVTAASRDYKVGDKTVELSGGSLSGLAEADKDTVGFDLGKGTLSDDSAGENRNVTTAITLTGNGHGDYTLTQPTGITVKINKASDPDYKVPSGIEAAVGDDLGDVELPKGWSWDSPETNLTDTGDQIFKATYTPENSNYETVKNVDITVTVKKLVLEFYMTAPCDVSTSKKFDLGAELKSGTAVRSFVISDRSDICTYGYICDPYEYNIAELEIRTLEFDEPRSGDFIGKLETSRYGFVDFVVHITLTGKYIVSISAQPENVIYDGEPHSGYTGLSGKLTGGDFYNGNDYTFTYYNKDDQKLDSAPSEPGDYKLVIAIPESNESYRGSLTLKFSIAEEPEAMYQATAGGEWIEGFFTDAVNKVYSGGTVKLLKDVDLTGMVGIDKKVTITSNSDASRAADAYTITATASAQSCLLYILDDVHLENIIIDGGSGDGRTSSYALIVVGSENANASLTLDNVIVRNNCNNHTDENGLVLGSGGGICVVNGSLIMNSGSKVTGNSVTGYGGGVCVISGSMTLNSGAEISGNTAQLDSRADRNFRSAFGGGVCVEAGATLTVSGGKITGNTAEYGGGIDISGKDAILNIYDGEITNNKAVLTPNGNENAYGGGIYAATVSETVNNVKTWHAPTVNISGGTISGNSAGHGGGIFIDSYATLNLTGGTVTGNSATKYAAGIECSPLSKINVSGAPVVSENTSSEETKGGLYVDGNSSAGWGEIKLGALSAGAKLSFYSYAGEDGFVVAYPADNHSITSSDMEKLSYNSKELYLALNASGNVICSALNITAAPLNVTYNGNPVSASGISQPEGISGTWSWADEDNVPTTVADSGTYGVVFTPNSSDYNPVTTTVQVTVSEKELTITGVEAESRAYDPDDLTVKLFGSDIELVGVCGDDDVGYTLGSGSIASAGAENAKSVETSITLTGEDKGNYTLKQPEYVTVDILKAVPGYSAPTGLTATYGDTLSDVDLSSFTGWAWMDETESVGNAGTNTFKASFTPEDTGNYKVVENIDVSVLVAKASFTAGTVMSGYAYGGTLPTPGVSTNPGNGTVTYYYRPSGSPEGDAQAWSLVTGSTTLNVGKYLIYGVIAATDNYDSCTASEVEFEIRRGTPKINSWPTLNDIYVDDPLTNAYLVGGSAEVGGSFSISDEDLNNSWDTARTTEVEVIFTPHSDNYVANSEDIELKVIPRVVTAISTFDAVEDKEFGTAFDHLELPGVINMTYTGNKTLLVSINWDESTYNSGTLDEQTVTGTLDLTGFVGRIEQATPEIQPSITVKLTKKVVPAPEYYDKTVTFNGSPVTHEIAGLTEMEGIKSATYKYVGINGTEYAESTAAPTNAGEYNVTASFEMKYGYADIEAKRSTLTIEPLDISDAAIVLGDSPVYTGDEQAVAITSVKVGDLDVSYEVVNNSNKGTDAGDYTLTIRGTGNFTGTATKGWSISKAPQTISAEDISATYGDEGKAVTAVGFGDITYSVVSGDDVLSVDEETGELEFFKAGTAVIKIYAAGDRNHLPGDKEIDVVVDKAMLTIIAAGKFAVVRSDAPDLSKPRLNRDYFITGFVGNDTELEEDVTVVLEYDDSLNMNKKGDYDIIPSVIGEDSRYDFIFKNGTLRVISRNSGTTTTPEEEENKPENGNGNSTGGSSFEDVPEDSYYKDAVDWAVDNSITTGMSSTLFNPNGICNRAQAVTFLWRASGEPEPQTNVMPFVDVPESSYYYTAVLWAVENGITKGTSSTTFSPDMNCSRAQIVTFLWRTLGTPEAGTANPFADIASDAYYTEAVLWAVKQSVTTGTGDGAFSPDADCTRAQIVTFIYRALKK